MFSKHTVVSNTKLNEKFHALKFKATEKNFNFKVGQFVLFKIKNGILRSYSIASLPDKLPFWEIFVDVTPGGPGTTYIKSLKRGDVVETSDPTGQFLLNSRAENYIFAATGCGIAPFLAMTNELTKNKNKNTTIFWGLRKEKEIVNLKPIEPMIVLSQPETKWLGRAGHVTEFVLAEARKAKNKNAAIYLSGSREFVSETAQRLEKEGFPTKKIYFESCY